MLHCTTIITCLHHRLSARLRWLNVTLAIALVDLVDVHNCCGLNVACRGLRIREDASQYPEKYCPRNVRLSNHLGMAWTEKTVNLQRAMAVCGNVAMSVIYVGPAAAKSDDVMG